MKNIKTCILVYIALGIFHCLGISNFNLFENVSILIGYDCDKDPVYFGNKETAGCSIDLFFSQLEDLKAEPVELDVLKGTYEVACNRFTGGDYQHQFIVTNLTRQYIVKKDLISLERSEIMAQFKQPILFTKILFTIVFLLIGFAYLSHTRKIDSGREVRDLQLAILGCYMLSAILFLIYFCQGFSNCFSPAVLNTVTGAIAIGLIYFFSKAFKNWYHMPNTRKY